MRVLVAEDEAVLAAAIAKGLRREGMAVDVVGDGREAMARVGVHGYDVVVLDRDLPEAHGDDVCRAIVASGVGARVLMLTAASGVADRVHGLTIGADDYLTKPFAFAELVARVRALARRPEDVRPTVLERAGVRLDPARRVATRDGEYLPLTRKELGVLEVLLAADGAVVSAEHLLDKVWDEHTDPFTNVVRVTMMTLRRKLGEPAVVHTVVGAGYRVDAASDVEP